VSRFYGIVVTMYYNDHNPPHFHARYGSHRALIAIDGPSLWAVLRREQLMRDWERGAFTGAPGADRSAGVAMVTDIVAATPIAPYRLLIRFDDGTEGEIDIAQEIAFYGVFEPLADPAFFAQVRVDPELGTVVWPNGADLDPIVLHARITGQAVSMPPPSSRRSLRAP
jgi:hypothetical protein